MAVLFTITITIGAPGFVYFATRYWSVIHSDIFPITWIVMGSFYFFPGCLIHSYFITLLQIGISLIACNRGILTQIFFSSFIMSYSWRTTGFLVVSHFGNGGTLCSWMGSWWGWVCTRIFGISKSCRITSFTTSFESSSSFSSRMMTDDLGLSFTTL